MAGAGSCRVFLPWRRIASAAGLATAEITHEATYITSENTNNPIGLFAIVAAWDGETVTMPDCTQRTANIPTQA